IIAAYSAYKKYTRWETLLATALASLSRTRAPIERIKQAQRRFESVQNSAIAAQFFLGQLRSIGDGIAWWFLDYDRATLRLLAEHSYISVPQFGTGLNAEIEKCAELRAQAIPFLLNSITNFLRFGDITSYDEPTDTYKLIEVKAGQMQTSRKLLRQKENLSLVQEAIDSGTHNLAEPGITHTRIFAQKPLLTYAKILETAMHEAKEKFASSRIFGDYLSFCLFSMEKLITFKKPISKKIMDDTIERCFSIRKMKDDLILPSFSNILHIVHFSRMLAPYTIFPIDNELRFSLISGDYLLLIHININGLSRWLEKRGWEVKILPLPDKPPTLSRDKHPYIPIMRISKPNNPLVVELPLDILCAAAMELWMPESIERLIQAIYSHGYSKMALTVNFPNTGKYAWD
ncbi:hypothetical protein KA005_58130, partial [bacterium]|nr:hypothetical protein [bacterium]